MIFPQPSGRFSEKTISVRVDQVSMRKKMMIPAILAVFQESAHESATQLGWGWEDMQSRNEYWVLSKLRLTVLHYAKWRDTITIFTWPDGADGLQAYRHFLIKDADGNDIAHAHSSWVILNAETKRLARVNADRDPKLFVPPGPHVVKPKKIVALENAEELAQFRVNFSDMDFNEHVNNTAYVRWLFDALPLEKLASSVVKMFAVDFMREAQLGERIVVNMQTVDETTSRANLVNHDGSETCRFQLKWKSA